MNQSWEQLIPEEELRIYEQAGFGGKIGLGHSPALVIIDVQYRTVGFERSAIASAIEEMPTACGEAGWSAVERTAEVLTAARDNRVPVFYPYVAPKDASDAGRLLDKVPTMSQVPAKGYDFVAEVAPEGNDVLVPKRHPSAFFGTPFTSYLISRGIDTLLLCGCTTSGCIRATAVDAFSLNFRVAVIEECVYDRSQTSHLVNLFDMNSKYADVISAQEAIAYLASSTARRVGTR